MGDVNTYIVVKLAPSGKAGTQGRSFQQVGTPVSGDEVGPPGVEAPSSSPVLLKRQICLPKRDDH
jgi:hypothetical protein